MARNSSDESFQQIFRGQNVNSPNDIFSQSINTLPSIHDYLISENMLAGQRFDGRMSNVRRFFCLFVTFDLLFTSLMWLVCVVLNGENIMKALNEQIIHYNIHTSLFDIVLVAFCRFIILLLFYALCYMNHWIIISLSTALTSMFLISKVFVYDWPHSSQPVFEVLLVLVSFILSWGEAWFLDYRVIPQESYASRYYITNRHSERAPLIQQYINGFIPTYTESVANYYSPLGSPEGSETSSSTDSLEGSCPSVHLTIQEEGYFKTMALQILQEAWDLLHSTEWHVNNHQDFDFVSTMITPQGAKIYKLTASIDVPPRHLFDELFYNVEQIPTWNKALLESHKVKTIDDNTDICYQISADGAGGLVSKRDFLTLRHWQLIEGCYIIACKGIEHSSIPISDKYVRGSNGTGCWSMQPDPIDQTKCHFNWILDINLNMRFLLQPMKDTAVIGMMFDYAKDLRLFLQHFNDK